MTTSELVIAGAVAVVGYLFLRLRILEFVQPIRLNIANSGENLLNNKYLDENQRACVRFILDQTYNPLIILRAVFTAPVTLIVSIVNPKRRDKIADFMRVDDRPTERHFRRLFAEFVISVAMANPICFVLLLFENVVFLLVSVLLRWPIAVVWRIGALSIASPPMQNSNMDHAHSS